MLKLREYQKESIDIALKKEKSIIVLPTGLGKTIIGIYFIKKLFKNRKIKRAIVLVPTRILVEQTHRMYNRLGLKSAKIYGILPKQKRLELWNKSNIIISTPETVYNDLEYIDNVDALVIDECHHSIGNDPYVKVLSKLDVKYKLGLTAFVPSKYKKFLEKLIGEIIEIPKISKDVYKYIPVWIGDIFETPFNNKEKILYEKIDSLRKNSKGSEKLLYTLALKYFSSDGAISLKDSISRDNKLSKLLSEYKDDIYFLRNLHKLDELYRILNIYSGFTKAIIFVDRLATAKYLYEKLKLYHEYKIVLIRGRLREKMKHILDETREADIIISTSAGEEGVDLPEADLLIVVSNSSNPIRFIQRHGRILRPSEKIKFATYLVTPDTIDMDIFLSSIEVIKKHIDLPISKETLRHLWSKSRLSRVLNILYEPLSEDLLSKISGYSIKNIRLVLKKGIEFGKVVYFYTPLGKTYILKDFTYVVKQKYPNSFHPVYTGIAKINVKNKVRKIHGDYFELLSKLSKYLPINSLTILQEKKYGDIKELVPLYYNYVIDSKLLLELVIKNALSDIKKYN